MTVILREDVANLGRSGEVVTVKDGFGRNFLLPRKMAVLANERNIKQLEHEQGVISAEDLNLFKYVENAEEAWELIKDSLHI